MKCPYIGTEPPCPWRILGEKEKDDNTLYGPLNINIDECTIWSGKVLRMNTLT